MNYIISVIFLILSIAASTILPIGLCIYFNRKYEASFKAAVIGAVIFIVSQPILRFPFLKLIQGTSWFSYNSAVNPWLISIFLGFTAAIFENTGRLIAFKYFLKDKLQWKNGIAYGLGHGGIEAILIVGLPFIGLILSNLSNLSIINAVPIMYLVSGIERISAMTLHIATSLMVLYAVRTKKYGYFLLAILVHGIIDSSIGFIKNIAVIEIWFAAFAVSLLVFIIMKIRKSSNEKILG